MSEGIKFYRAPGAPQEPDTDYIVRATAYDGQVRALCVRTTNVCRKAWEIHQTSPVATAAFGRFMTASLLLADTMKNAEDTQTTNIKSDGPIGGMTAVCDAFGHVRGVMHHPVVESTYHSPGKLNVAAAVGKGILTVVRDLGMKEPYIGSVELVSGEIAEDFTYYLAVSEQTPSIVSLGVMMDSHGVKHAGGFLVQVLPGAGDEVIDRLEARATGGFPDITFLIEEGLSPEKILDMFLGDPQIDYLSANAVSYQCNCSRERMEKGLITLGKDELTALAGDKDDIQLECHFCGKSYRFDQDQILALLQLL
jgi:molecular chaperone Hsp33